MFVGVGGRKRAIRGGGPAGDGESVVFRGAIETTSCMFIYLSMI